MTATAHALPEVVNEQLPAPSAGGALAASLTNPFDVTAVKARLEALRQFFAEVMVEGEDFGVIPGTKGLSLLKPGAEKLCEFYGLTQRPRIAQRHEQWDPPFFLREYELDLLDRRTGAVIGTGIGSCNSMEARYRWRQGERVCPECGQAAIIKGKPEYGGGWVCFKRKDGCGAKFGADDPAIVDQKVGRIENDDIATMHNTIIKMAKKRALVDGIVSVTRSAGLLIEAAEEDDDHDDGGARTERTPARTVGGGASAPTITPDEHKALNAAWTATGKPWSELVGWVAETLKVDLTKQRLPREHLAAVQAHVEATKAAGGAAASGGAAGQPAKKAPF